MTLIQHSGNLCSGLCLTPCGHDGCWQCVDDFKAETERAVKARAERAVKAQEVRSKKAIDILAGEVAMTQRVQYSENQTVSITRAALEGLIGQVPGLSMEWNGGYPIVIRNEPSGPVGRKLNDVHGAWVPEVGVLAEAVRISGTPDTHKRVSAAKEMQAEVERILREKAKAEEQQAREVLKAQGASDDDIAAAADLLGWDPTKPLQRFFTDDMIIATWGPHANRILDVKHKGLMLGEFTDVD